MVPLPHCKFFLLPSGVPDLSKLEAMCLRFSLPFTLSMEDMLELFQIIPYKAKYEEKKEYFVELADSSDSMEWLSNDLPNDDSATSGWKIEELE